ncbi:phosphoribosylanthranilate isomerase [Ammoniphilus sp. CFH 90114]|uniref:phosphoribosylanthranilate isomerase n=1 Tax=Ammoniphilus sp. CFH 90114 TaxID=2493665 RepID=UPI00100DA043|nr:phosphoribosylanthranilate isomerase [Ammoniphilus sp. CFH 90114]RXT13915.1 phosphoribosylanthranilate isomerase [Ammoniphilus sp. CFH 90114]
MLITRPLIKCCGFQDVEDIVKLESVDIDFVGFILAPSKRRVPLEKLPTLVEAVPAGKKKVGVFVNPSLTEIRDVMSIAKLDVVQLHGQETPSLCKEIKGEFGVEIIKVVHIDSTESMPLPLGEYGDYIDFLLLDTFDKKMAGGTGKTFRWEVIPAYQQWCVDHHVKLLVAGGITPENVGQLISDWPLGGVDVASGIETEGKKALVKMLQLVERVKEYGGRA